MKNNFKKIIAIFIICICGTSLSFASWWDPMSWKIFSKKIIQEKSVIISATSTKEVVLQDKELLVQKVAEKNYKNIATQTTPKNSNPEIKSTKKKIEIKKENIVKKDFKDELISLYEKKVKFVKIRILLRNAAGPGGGNLAIKYAKEDIDYFEKNRRADDSQDFKEVNVKAVAFWKTLIEERQKIINYENSIIATQEQILKKLEKEKSDIDSSGYISETEYKLRLSSLSLLVDENNFEKEYSEQDKTVSDIIAYHNETNDKYNKLMIRISERDLSAVQEELVTIRADIESSKARSAYYGSLVEKIRIDREQKQIKPTSVSCETSYSKGIGYPVTNCTEYPTMKTYRCETSYNVAGNSIKNCY